MAATRRLQSNPRGAPPIGSERAAAAGVELRRRRKALGLTQSRLARALQVAPNTLARWERGEVSIGHPERLEGVLAQLESKAEVFARVDPPDHPFRGPRLLPSAPGLGAAVLLDELPPSPVAELSSFIGRERMLEDLAALLPATGLVTLSGPGGVGKTRLAVRVALRVADAFPAGVWPVELASVSDSSLLCQAVARVLHVRIDASQPLAQALAAAIRERRLLLVLDNCEHLLRACAELVETLRRACSNLTVLATSREPLGAVGELAWPVAPLEIPDTSTDNPDALGRVEAVRLLLDRTRAHDATFKLTAANAAPIAEICRRLDGLPLALELAAARLPLLGATEVAARLDEGLRLLNIGQRTAPARHQTLRATLQWDYDMLNVAERTLFRRLSVFGGAFDAAAAAAVCPDDDVAPHQVVSLLAQLVQRALVGVQHSEDGTAHRLLEIIRLFALERLESDAPEAAHARDRHAAYFAELVSSASDPSGFTWGPGAARTLARIDRYQADLRKALRWLIGSSQSARAMGLGLHLTSWWAARGYLVEGRAWLAELVALPRVEAAEGMRARLLAWSAVLANLSGLYMAAWPLAQEALALGRALGDRVSVAIALQQTAWFALGRGDRQAGEALFREAIDTSSAAGAVEIEAQCRAFLSLLLLGTGDIRASESEAATAMSLAYGNSLSIEQGRAELASGLIDLQRGHHGAARRRLGSAVALLGSGGNRFWEAAALTGLGRAAAADGDAAVARRALTEAVEIGRSLGGWPLLRGWVEACAMLARAEGRPRAALMLAGVASLVEHRPGVGLPIVLPSPGNRWLESTRAAVGPSADAVWAEGRSLSPQDAMQTGIDYGNDQARIGRDPRADEARITPRERQVADLVAQGRTNREIGRELVITEGTARVHVERILGKLELRSRAQLAAWAVAQSAIMDGRLRPDGC